MTESSNVPPLSNHKIFLFYAFKRQSNEAWDAPPPAKTFDDLLQKQNSSEKVDNWIYPHAEAFFKDRYASFLIWQPGKLKLGKDLYPHIKNSLGESGQQAPDAKVYELSQHARNFIIEGKLVHNPDQLSQQQKQRKKIKINLSPSAFIRIQKKCNTASAVALYLKPDNIQAICFRTGWIIVTLETKIVLSDNAPLDPVWLQEAMATLTKVNKLSWDDPTPDKINPDKNNFHLGEMISGLVGLPRKNIAQRVFSTVYLQFDQYPPQHMLVELQTRLSRHYTDDYDIIDQPKNQEIVKEFNNVGHAFSLEGCSSYCISPKASSVEFLKNYFNTAYRLHYMPIILLAVHEYTHLLELTNDSSFWPVLNDKNLDDINELTRIRDAVLHFRLCFRYSAVSHITMHNQTNIALRKTFGLDTLLAELDNDTKEINAFLEQNHAERSSEKLHWVSVVAALVITFSASYQTLDVLLSDVFDFYGINMTTWKINAFFSLTFSAIAVRIIGMTKPKKR